MIGFNFSNRHGGKKFRSVNNRDEPYASRRGSDHHATVDLVDEILAVAGLYNPNRGIERSGHFSKGRCQTNPSSPGCAGQRPPESRTSGWANNAVSPVAAGAKRLGRRSGALPVSAAGPRLLGSSQIAASRSRTCESRREQSLLALGSLASGARLALLRKPGSHQGALVGAGPSRRWRSARPDYAPATGQRESRAIIDRPDSGGFVGSLSTQNPGALKGREPSARGNAF